MTQNETKLTEHIEQPYAVVTRFVSALKKPETVQDNLDRLGNSQVSEKPIIIQQIFRNDTDGFGRVRSEQNGRVPQKPEKKTCNGLKKSRLFWAPLRPCLAVPGFTSPADK